MLISGSGSNLQAFIDACRDPAYPCTVAAVISNRPGVRGLERATAAGIASEVLDHTRFASREEFDAALLARVDAYRPDLVILAGFMRILTPGFVRHYAGRLLNIHPSLLPKYPGLHTHRRALEAGDAEHGATVHFVTADLDGGPPVVQARVAVLPGDDEATLAARVLEHEHLIYPLAARLFAEGRLRLREGRAELDGAALPAHGMAM
ncbi:MAG: Phosphoribosylglycinamide formyltransferase [Pseudomonadales bacterium]|nr:Phosphoribosylglycinamide formyltransferase [Pseudomonadales bacterium]